MRNLVLIFQRSAKRLILVIQPSTLGNKKGRPPRLRSGLPSLDPIVIKGYSGELHVLATREVSNRGYPLTVCP